MTFRVHTTFIIDPITVLFVSPLWRVCKANFVFAKVILQWAPNVQTAGEIRKWIDYWLTMWDDGYFQAVRSLRGDTSARPDGRPAENAPSPRSGGEGLKRVKIAQKTVLLGLPDVRTCAMRRLQNSEVARVPPD